MSPMQMKISVYLIATGFVLTALLVLSGLFLYYGPCIEPYVAGYVVRINPPDQTWRGYITKKESHREVEVGCFRLHDLRKLVPAVPIKYAFDVEAKLSDKIPTSAYVAGPDHQSLGEDLQTHRVGEVWDRGYCFEMPGTIADSQSVRVSGHAEHTRIVAGARWPFWASKTPVPEFTLLPVRCYREEGGIDPKQRDFTSSP